MRKIGKKIAIILSAIVVLSMSACKFPTGDSSTGNYVDSNSANEVDGTTHDKYVGTSEHKIVENGRTNYKILVDSEERALHSEAIGELQYFFQQATGLNLSVELDEGKTHEANAKYISLGRTSALADSGISVDYSTLGRQGFQIETKDQSIYICGETKGILWGVYELLHTLLDYEMYSNEYYSLDRNITNLDLPVLRIKDIPDIEYRYPISGSQYQRKTEAHRMRFTIDQEVIMTGGRCHNILDYIVPINEYKDTHIDWFSGDQTQLCYTAHGKSDEYQLMVDVAVENVKKLIVASPNADSLSITQMDVQTWCECPTCQGLEDYYGTNAASQIKFVNDVVAKVNPWLEEEQNGRKVNFMIFAYHKAELAPARKNAEGKYEPIDETVVLDPSVSVWIAPIYEDYTISVNDPMSSNIRLMLESWHACASSYWVWAYNVYFNNYLIPYDSYDALQDLIKYCVSHNTQYFWAQGSYNLSQSTGYDDLKNYIASKLMWDCNLDVGTLIADYFDNVYQEAADIMEESFWTWRALSQWQEHEMKRSGSIYSAPTEAEYWPKQYLVGQIERMEQALTLIEKYKTTDPTLYQSIRDSILAETISPRYLLLRTYSHTYSAGEFALMKKEFKADVTYLNFNMISESTTMSSFVD